LTDIAMLSILLLNGEVPMSSSLNIQLTDELRKFVDGRAGNDDMYATPSEYIRYLIRKDMEEQGIVEHVIEGLDDLKHSRFSVRSILDFKTSKH
jgi:antitoxin ParD1/3/4